MKDLAREIESVARDIESNASAAFSRNQDSAAYSAARQTASKLKRIADEVRQLQQPK